MAVIGNPSTNGIMVSKHIDGDNFITILFYIGQPLHEAELTFIVKSVMTMKH